MRVTGPPKDSVGTMRVSFFAGIDVSQMAILFYPHKTKPRLSTVKQASNRARLAEFGQPRTKD